MGISRTFTCLTLGWSLLLVAGLHLTGGLIAAPGDAAAMAQAKQDRRAAVAHADFVRCLTLSYAAGQPSGASQREVTNACAQKSDGARAALIRAGFPVPQAQKVIDGIALATYREMLILIPPCPEDKAPARIS